MFIPKFDNIIVFDTETTINAPKPYFGATPAYIDNEVVACGWKHLKKGGQKPEVQIAFDSTMEGVALHTHSGTDEVILVGHNISFDLHYLMEVYGDVPRNVVVWDTMKFEYMDSGRASANPSLEKTAQRYGIPFKKDDEVSERFKMGMGADKIDKELLSEYLEQDVEVTYKIFNTQIKKCLDKGAAYTNYMVEMMQGVTVTTSMSFHGMPFNVYAAQREVNELEKTMDRLVQLVKAEWGDHNYNSPAQVKLLLWGGERKEEYMAQKYDEDGEELAYKSGKKKGELVRRKATKLVRVDSLVTTAIEERFSNRGFSKDASATTLDRLVKMTSDLTSLHRFCRSLLKLRGYAKSINTYFQPYIEHTLRGYIHPNYNHSVTNTGRLSSSKPNMQNISNKGEEK